MFVNQMSHLLIFLEYSVEVNPNRKAEVYNTLLELYLRPNVGKDTVEKRDEREEKALALLKNASAKYDDNQCSHFRDSEVA